MATKTMKIGLSTSDKSTMSATIQAAVLSIVAPTYSSSSLYAVGDLVYYNGGLYKCKTAITTAEAWTAAHWTATTFADEEKGKLSRGDHDGTTSVGRADSAKSLDTQVGNDDQTPFSANTVGIYSDVETGQQELRKLVGVDVVDVQLARPLNATYWTYTEGTITFSDGVCSLEPTSEAHWPGIRQTTLVPINEHKYFIMFDFKGDTSVSMNFGGFDGQVKNDLDASKWNTIVKLVSSNTNSGWLSFFVLNGTNTQLYKNIVVIDLTQRYGSNEVVNAILGSGTDAEKVANLIAFDPNILKLTSYDAGSFPTVKAAKLETVDYNQWDEETELGYYDVANGGYVYRSDGLCSKRGHNIRIAVGQNVYAYLGDNNSASIVAIFFDANGNYLGYDTRRNANFTIPFGAYSMAFYLNSYGTTYNHDISIFLYWDGSRIGYEPYQKHEVALPNERLHGVLKVVNGKVVADGDELYPKGKRKTRWVAYTFNGTESVNIVNTATDGDSVSWTRYSVAATTNGLENTTKGIQNINPEITFGNSGSTSTGYRISVRYNGFYIIVKTSDYAGTSALLSAITGKTIVYPIATETEADSDAYADTFYGDDFGTMRFLDENGNEIAGLLGCEIFYKANIAGFAESLYVKTDGKPDDVVVQSELTAEATARGATDNALQEALGGTLRQVLCVKESLDFDNTAYVDLGSLTWNYSNVNQRFSTSFNATGSGNNNTPSKLVCTKYKNYAYNSLANNGIAISSDGLALHIMDSNYTDKDTFKAAMKGVLLAYEKASE